MKRIINRGNLTILLILLLVGHNIYLQLKIDESTNAVKEAQDIANSASYYASEAANFANETLDYASEASENSRKAWYAAEDAAMNSFGHQCWTCP